MNIKKEYISLAFSGILFCPTSLMASDLNNTKIIKRLDALEKRNIELEKEIKFLRKQISLPSKDSLPNKERIEGSTDFAKTTTLGGEGTMVFGGKNFRGSNSGNYGGFARTDYLNKRESATTFTYNYKLDIDSSFFESDFLKLSIKYADGGQFGSNQSIGGIYSGIGQLDDFQNTSFGLDRFWYKFPLSEKITAYFGPEISQEDMLAVWPSIYTTENILSFFNYAGAPGAYNKNKGGGLGLTWENDDLSFSLNYTSDNGTDQDPHFPNGGGMFTDAAGSNITLQGAYNKDDWGMAIAYSLTNSNTRGPGLDHDNATALADRVQEIGKLNSVGISGWISNENKKLPNISAGFGISNVVEDECRSSSSACSTYNSAEIFSWSVGMNWDDLFVDGNTGGIAFGQPAHVTSIKRDDGDNTADDKINAYEMWYQFKVNNYLTVTPAIYYLDRPLGYFEDSGSNAGTSLNEFGALIKTTFKF